MMKTSKKISIGISIIAACISLISLCIAIYGTLFAPSFEQLVYNGSILLEKGEYLKAIRCYDKALEIKSGDPNVLRDKGYALIDLGIDNKSVKVTRYSDAEKFITYYFEYYKNQNIKVNQYYFERAFQCFSEAKVLKPEDPEICLYYGILSLYLPAGPNSIDSLNQTLEIIKNLPPYIQEKYPVKLIKHCALYCKDMVYREDYEEK